MAKKWSEERIEGLLTGLVADPGEAGPGEAGAAGLTPADRAMLGYASKLTRLPAEVTSGDVDRLRQGGFDDRAIHDICAIVAYFAFVNRIADGLGVELEPPNGSRLR